MSLDKQAAAFTKSVQAQANFSGPRRVAAPTTSSTPAAASTPTTAPKRKRIVDRTKPIAPPIVYSQPTDTSLGTQHMMTQVHHAIQHLKQREVPQTPDQIASYLSIQMTPTLLQVLKQNERLTWNPAQGTLEYKPIHNIRSAQALLAHLQQQTTAQGLSVKELKDGWAGAVETIADLEESGDILVTRTKKDNQPRMVWINDKTLDIIVEDEFKAIWHKIVIPPPGDLPGELEKAGLKPTSVDPATIKKEVKGGAQKGRKRAQNRRVKVSNVHMNHILKDSKDLKR